MGKFIKIASLVVIIIILIFWSIRHMTPKENSILFNPLPDVSNMAEIKVNMPDKDLSQTEVILNKKDYSRFYSLFSKSKIDNNPAEWQKFALVFIGLNNSKTINISIFKTFDHTGAFRISGKYYRGGVDEDFQNFLRTLKDEGVKSLTPPTSTDSKLEQATTESSKKSKPQVNDTSIRPEEGKK